MTEYAIIAALVITVAIGTTTFLKRALQARIYDARQAMLEVARTANTGAGGIGNLANEYEPYYAQTTSNVVRNIDEQTSLSGDYGSGEFGKIVNNEVTVNTTSTQLPPGTGRADDRAVEDFDHDDIE